MGRVVNYILHSGCAVSLANVLAAEFARNKKEVRANTGVGHNYSAEESLDTLAILDSEISVCRSVGLSAPNDSVCGESTIPALFNCQFKCVDAATLCNHVVSFSECKVAMKRAGFGPFYNERIFVRKVAEKFDKVEAKITADGDTVSSSRLVVVSDAVMDRAVELVDELVSLQLPEGCFSTDGRVHNYVLCSPSTVGAVIGGVCRAYPTANAYSFTL